MLQQLVNNTVQIDSMYTQMQALVAAGMAEKLDVSRISVQRNNLRNEQTKLSRMREMSMLMLKMQMGMPAEENFSLSDKLPESMDSKALGGVDVNYSEITKYAMLETQREVEMLNVKRYKVGYYPSLYFTGRLGANSGGNSLKELDAWYEFGMIGLTLNIPIFDGFLKKHQIQEAKLSLMKTENTMEQMRQMIDVQLRQAALSYQNSMHELKVQEENRVLAQEVYDITAIKFKAGVGSSLEVVEAETAKKNADTSYYQALHNALMAKLDYDKAKGQLISE